MEKNIIPKKVTTNVSTFAILDKISDIENLLDRQVDIEKEEDAFIKIEKTYKDLKEQLFESFYTSADIENIIIDPQHRHHELVMRLYHEYMDEVSFLDFENIEQDQEETETYFYFTDPNAIKSSERTFSRSYDGMNRDLDECKSEALTEVHTSMNLTEIFNLENKIESLIALLIDLLETHKVSYKTVDKFLEVTNIDEYQDRLGYIISGYSLKQRKYGEKLSQIDANLNEYMKSQKQSLRELVEDKAILKFKRKAAKVKNKMLVSMHNTYRDLDLMHERLYTFYHHLIEHIKSV